MFSFRPRIQRRFLRTRIQSLLRPPAAPAPSIPAVSATPPLPSPPPPPPPPDGLSAHAYRWETATPTATQLGYADAFFTRGVPAKHLWSQAKFRAIEMGSASPEVMFLGRSNVGKSSLLNAMMGHSRLAFTSSKPGRTRLLSAFAVNGGKAVVVDCPGYGHASREDWGVQVLKYLKSRKQ